jgi:endoglucanase
MKIAFRLLLSIVLVGVVVPVASGQGNGVAFRRVQHLRHGVNMSEWFSQAAPDAKRLATFTTGDDIVLVKRLGFDHVRMPVDPNIFLACRGAWEQCDNVRLFDAMVKKALAEDLAVIVDIHPSSEFKRQVATDGEAVEKFGELWRHISRGITRRTIRSACYSR